MDCLYLLVDAGDTSEVFAAEDAGFRLMDVRVELERATAPEPAAVREQRLGDVDALRAIARVSHGDTRFYADPRFPDDRCDELYDTWIRRSCEGWADVVLVTDDDTPSGYVSVHADPVASFGSIGLIAVAEEARGHGLGRELARGAVDWCDSNELGRITVATQARNVDAQRVFQQAGFRTYSVKISFHKWYER